MKSYWWGFVRYKVTFPSMHSVRSRRTFFSATRVGRSRDLSGQRVRSFSFSRPFANIWPNTTATDPVWCSATFFLLFAAPYLSEPNSAIADLAHPVSSPKRFPHYIISERKRPRPLPTWYGGDLNSGPVEREAGCFFPPYCVSDLK